MREKKRRIRRKERKRREAGRGKRQVDMNERKRKNYRMENENPENTTKAQLYKFSLFIFKMHSRFKIQNRRYQIHNSEFRSCERIGLP